MEDNKHEIEQLAFMLGLKPSKIYRWMKLKGGKTGSKEIVQETGRDISSDLESKGSVHSYERVNCDEFYSRVLLISKSIRLGMSEEEFVKRIQENKDNLTDFNKFLKLLHELTPDKSLSGLLINIYNRI